MIIIDVNEDKDLIKKIEEKVGKDGYKVEQLGVYDCDKLFFPIKEIGCLTADEVDILTQSGKEINLDKNVCNECDNRKYIRFADFTNEARSWFYERKTVLDFIASRKDRLYHQLDKMDTFIEGRKGLILEGMAEFVPIYDSYWKNIDKERLKGLSPLRQVIELGGRPEWTYSFIRELKMRDMEFVQTWNMEETVEFLIQCDKGYDHESKLRVIPKRYPDIPLEQNILVLFDGIGKMRSSKIMKDEKVMNKLNDFIDIVKERYGYYAKRNERKDKNAS